MRLGRKNQGESRGEAEDTGMIAVEAHIERGAEIAVMTVLEIKSEDTADTTMTTEKEIVKEITIEIVIIEAADTGLTRKIIIGNDLARVLAIKINEERSLGLGGLSVVIPLLNADVNLNVAETEMTATGDTDL
jgi:phosphosulfolactate synthase (CoM biosynthesis protein A)